MTAKIRAAICAAAPIALAAACATLFAVRPVDFALSLYDLAGEASNAVPQAVRNRSSNIVPLIVAAEQLSLARDAADSLFSALPDDLRSRAKYRFDGEGLSAVLDACRGNIAGLVSPRDAELLSSAEGRARIARAAARKYYSSPVPPIFGPVEDPFCLADGFVASLPVSATGWRLRDGVLAAERDGVFQILITLVLERSVADDTDALISFRARLDDILSLERDRHKDVSYFVCGVPLHTADAAFRCKREIGVLTVFSLLFIAALSVFAFRSVKWLPLLVASLLTSAFAGGLALILAFRSVHVMTLVFGTTVLGLVVDYSFHWLMREEGRSGETVRNLLVSFVTTEISLLPLAFSSLPVLRQSSVFLGVGLAAALALVLFGYPTRAVRAAAPRSGGFRFGGLVRLCVLPLIAFVACFASRVRFGTDVGSLYRPSDGLAAAERLFAELGGNADDGSGFVVVSGSGDLEFLLECEAAAGISGDTPRLSLFMPPLSVRRANATLVGELYREHGTRQAGLLGLDGVTAPPEPAAWSWEDVPQVLSDMFVSDGALIVASAVCPNEALPDGVQFCRPKDVLGAILSKWTHETTVMLAVAFVLMFITLLIILRKSAVAAILPSLAAVAASWCVVAALGERVNMFHVLACFLLAGMGVDYAVFLHSGSRAALKPATCSILTSMAGFGALAFVSFPVVRAFGVVLGAGLPVAFMVAMATAPGQGQKTEHGASPVGLGILFLLYRMFGLGFLHFCASVVGLSVWVFSGAVRRASPSPRKLIAFTRSLADKLVVMANGRRLPSVSLDGFEDSAAFVSDVASRKGVFVLSSHCGTVEVLAALGECNVKFHAWMEFERTSVFNAFYMKHANRSKVEIHPISEFGPGTVFFAGDALDSGECLVMAGDRGFGRMRRVRFQGGEIELPEGAFRFAHALGHPVYFVACVATGGCSYRAIVRRLPDGTDDMAVAYADALGDVTRKYPEQWFKWDGGQA